MFTESHTKPINIIHEQNVELLFIKIVNNIKYRLKVFENIVLRKIFGSMRDKIIGSVRTTYQELHNLYSSANIIRIIK
jgi:hypothetical protein